MKYKIALEEFVEKIEDRHSHWETLYEQGFEKIDLQKLCIFLNQGHSLLDFDSYRSGLSSIFGEVKNFVINKHHERSSEDQLVLDKMLRIIEEKFYKLGGIKV